MKIYVTLNGSSQVLNIKPNETLLRVLRREGLYSVKHGCEDGTCGVCSVILDGKVINSCILLAAQTDEKRITTIEGLGTRKQLDPLQAAFVEAGAIQCGYCTPARILAAKALLDENAHPTEEDVRDAMSGVLCRCTGNSKPVEAVMQVVNGKGEVRNVPPV